MAPRSHDSQRSRIWAHRNQTRHHWSSAIHRTAHRRAPCQQQTSSLHNVPPEPVSTLCLSSNDTSADQSADLISPKGRNWRTLVLNANGLARLEKHTNYANLVEYAKPDAIIISKTLLHNDVHNSEFMPPSYSTPLQKDQEKRGGGILITVKDCYTITVSNLPETDAKIVWGEVLLRGNKQLCPGSY